MKMRISQRALFQRINRKLAKVGQRLHSGQNKTQSFNKTGQHYIVDQNNNITATHLDLEGIGRELGVMHGHETLAK